MKFGLGFRVELLVFVNKCSQPLFQFRGLRLLPSTTFFKSDSVFSTSATDLHFPLSRVLSSDHCFRICSFHVKPLLVLPDLVATRLIANSVSPCCCFSDVIAVTQAQELQVVRSGNRVRLISVAMPIFDSVPIIGAI